MPLLNNHTYYIINMYGHFTIAYRHTHLLYMYYTYLRNQNAPTHRTASINSGIYSIDMYTHVDIYIKHVAAKIIS